MSKLQVLRPSKLYNSKFRKVRPNKLGDGGNFTIDMSDTRKVVAMAT